MPSSNNNNGNDNGNGTEDEDFIGLTDAESIIVERIRHTLRIYPRISPSMLQVGIGTALTPSLWRPVYERMKEDGEIEEQTVQAQTPTGRIQVYTVISLKQAA